MPAAATTGLAALRRRAASLGATVVINRRAPKLDCEVLAPEGMVFEDLHSIVGHQLPGRSVDDVVADMLQRMELGATPCDVPDCDTCNDND